MDYTFRVLAEGVSYYNFSFLFRSLVFFLPILPSLRYVWRIALAVEKLTPNYLAASLIVDYFDKIFLSNWTRMVWSMIAYFFCSLRSDYFSFDDYNIGLIKIFEYWKLELYSPSPLSKLFSECIIIELIKINLLKWYFWIALNNIKSIYRI